MLQIMILRTSIACIQRQRKLCQCNLSNVSDVGLTPEHTGPLGNPDSQ